MPTYAHPGVYIEEVAGPKAVQGTTTNVGAFVGVAEQGPYNVATLITGWDHFVTQCGDFIWSRYLAYAVYSFFDQGGSYCYVVRAQADITAEPIQLSGSGVSLSVTPTSPGTWANYLWLQVKNYPEDVASTTPGQTTASFTLAVVYKTAVPLTAVTATAPEEALLQQYILNNNIVGRKLPDTTSGAQNGYSYFYYLETYQGLSVTSPDPNSPLTQDQLQVWVQGEFDQLVNNVSQFIKVAVTVQSTTPQRPQNTLQPLADGAEAPTYDFMNRTNHTGIYAFDTIEDINLLVLPDLTSITDATTLRGLVQEALTYSRQRRSLFYVVDPPAGLSTQNVVDFVGGTGTYSSGGGSFNSSYGAIYYPWVYVLNPATKKQILVPPSGSVAGIYAQTDQRAGVFKAPAGTQDGIINMAVGLETILSDSDQDLLNPLGINAIRKLLSIGITVWGARTLSADPAWIYINVRRLVTYIEESLRRFSRIYVFEPNSTSLWARVNRDYTDFLTTVWRQGALFGNTASEAFFVVVDSSNNPPQSREQGILFVDVGVAPVKPAEFIVIRIRQIIPGPT